MVYVTMQTFDLQEELEVYIPLCMECLNYLRHIL